MFTYIYAIFRELKNSRHLKNSSSHLCRSILVLAATGVGISQCTIAIPLIVPAALALLHRVSDGTLGVSARLDLCASLKPILASYYSRTINAPRISRAEASTIATRISTLCYSSEERSIDSRATRRYAALARRDHAPLLRY